jgi:hypothetical protein
MAKQRTLNEIRQSKEYQRALDIQTKKVQDNITHPCSESTAKAIAEHQLEFKGENFYKNPFSHADVDKTVETIVEKLDGHIYDLIFQAVCDEMNDHYVFDSTEYLTSAGLELFEDEWFEFYHENHGRIMHKLMSRITN